MLFQNRYQLVFNPLPIQSNQSKVVTVPYTRCESNVSFVLFGIIILHNSTYTSWDALFSNQVFICCLSELPRFRRQLQLNYSPFLWTVLLLPLKYILSIIRISVSLDISYQIFFGFVYWSEIWVNFSVRVLFIRSVPVLIVCDSYECKLIYYLQVSRSELQQLANIQFHILCFLMLIPFGLFWAPCSLTISSPQPCGVIQTKN